MAIDVIVGREPIWDEKYADETLNWAFDLAPYLSSGDAIQSVSWSVTPSGAGAAAVSSSLISGMKVTLFASGGEARKWYAFKANWTSSDGVHGSFTFRLFIREDAEQVSELGSALFPNRFTATRSLLNDRLMMAAKTLLPSISLSEEYVWQKLRAAEADIGRTLRVPLQPTRYFVHQPTQQQIDALAGAAWGIDPAYDYGPEFFEGERWGFILLRNKPLISVQGLRLVYPAPAFGVYDVPLDWIRMDRKYGHIRLVPASSAFLGPMGAFMMQALGGGRTIPFAIELNYTAGIENAARDFPDLIDVAMKAAALKIVEDTFLPQSGSISADGLSQSMSVDMEKYRDAIDHVLNGPKGSNGGLMTAIHGVRLGVMG